MDRWYRLYPPSVRAAESEDGAPLQRRNASRLSVFSIGALVLADGFEPPPACSVRDISCDGARLELDSTAKFPLRHALKLPDHLHIYLCPQQIELDCRLVWQDGRHFGVAFVGDIPPVVRTLAEAAEARPTNLPELPRARIDRLRRPQT